MDIVMLLIAMTVSVGGVQGSHGGKSHTCGDSNISCGVG